MPCAPIGCDELTHAQLQGRCVTRAAHCTSLCFLHLLIHSAVVKPATTAPPTAMAGPIIPPVAAVSADPSAKNLVAQAAIQAPWAVLQATAAAGSAAPPVAAPNVKPADA